MRARGAAGFTLVELLIVVAVIGILAAIALPIYSNVQTRARVAKAQADARGLASAVVVYAAHMNVLPTGLLELTTTATNTRNEVAGPFMAAVPAAPSGWSGYAYTANTSDGAFTISAMGDTTTIRVP